MLFWPPSSRSWHLQQKPLLRASQKHTAYSCRYTKRIRISAFLKKERERLRGRAKRFFEAIAVIHKSTMQCEPFSDVVERQDCVDVELPNPFEDVHHFEVPSRILVCGTSGSGKTYSIEQLLSESQTKNVKTFLEVVVVTTTESQKVWQTFKKEYDAEIINPYDEAMPSREEDRPLLSRLIVFDDCLGVTRELTNQIQKFFTKGRHQGWTCVFISQSFVDCDKLIKKKKCKRVHQFRNARL